MNKFIKVESHKNIKVPVGYRIGGIIINGKYIKRSKKKISNTTIKDDNKFILKLQGRLFQRSLEWIRKKIFKRF